MIYKLTKTYTRPNFILTILQVATKYNYCNMAGRFLPVFEDQIEKDSSFVP